MSTVCGHEYRSAVSNRKQGTGRTVAEEFPEHKCVVRFLVVPWKADVFCDNASNVRKYTLQTKPVELTIHVEGHYMLESEEVEMSISTSIAKHLGLLIRTRAFLP